MSEKEDSILEQTFGDYEGTTVSEQSEDPDAVANKVMSDKPKKNNKLVLIGAGVVGLALLGGVGVMFLGGESPIQPVAQVQPVQPQPAQPEVQPAVQPQSDAQQATAQPQQSDAQPAAQALPTVEVKADAQPQAVAQAPVEIKVDTQPQAVAQAPVEIKVDTQPQAVAQAPVEVKIEAQPTVQPVAEVQSVAAGATVGFESALSEVKGQIAATNVRVDKIESRLSDFEKKTTDDIKSLSDRVTKLEGGKVDAAPKSNVEKSDKHVVKKPKVKKVVTTVVSDDVLVDKSSSTKEEVKKSSKDEKITKYNINSVYGNRLWLVGDDGSHYSYTVGDKLPGGETVKNVDLEKGVISTDKGKIKIN